MQIGALPDRPQAARRDRRRDRRRGRHHAGEDAPGRGAGRTPSTSSAPAATPPAATTSPPPRAFVVAGAGVPVAKHGNRALSSKSGAADTLAALGVKIDLAPEDDRALHPRGRHRLHVRAGAPFGDEACRPGARRARLPHRLQPDRPAVATRRASSATCSASSRPTGSSRSPTCSATLGAERAWVVHGAGGFDEMSPAGETKVASLENGKVTVFTVTPDDAGLPASPVDAIKGGDAAHNAEALRAVLAGAQGRLPRHRAAQRRRGAGRRRPRRRPRRGRRARRRRHRLGQGRASSLLEPACVSRSSASGT